MREDGRRCLHTGELEANGYEKNEAGRWFHAAKAEQAKDRFAKALLAETVRFSAPQSLNPSRVPTALVEPTTALPSDSWTPEAENFSAPMVAVMPRACA